MHTDVTACMFTHRTQSSLLENPFPSASEKKVTIQDRKKNPH